MQPGANILNRFRHRPAMNLAFFNLTRATVDHFLPLSFRVRIHRTVETRNELAGEICPVLLRQGQHFSHFFSSNAHAGILSPITPP